MTAKDTVIEMIRRMPDSVTLSDIIARLSARQQMDDGLRELDKGFGIDDKEAQKRLARWLD